MSLHVHRSNRLESLADALAVLMREKPERPLQREIVVVQSLGMRRWLSLELAQRLGVVMNVQFPFPAKFAQEIFAAAFPGEERDDRYRRELLPWRVLALFPKLLTRPAWKELLGYVEGEARALKEYQLAQRIAAVLDRYLAFRPELLIEWQQRRKPDDWQSELWRELIAGRADRHPPAWLKRFETFASPRNASLSVLPQRVAVFGISSLPPFYLHLFESVARCLDLHLFLLEPTDQYWGDIQSRRERDRILRHRTESAEELHVDVANPLLASLCRAGQDFTRLVQDLEPARISETFAPPPPTHLLARVQADIFELRERDADEREEIATLDSSLQIHCCHGPMRELEVLHDQLLDLFQRIPGLAPRDVLVGMPDVETYAPFIEAVFGAPESAHLAVPFTIADRTARSENSVADAFLRILEMHGSRFTAPAVLALLESAAVRQRFGLVEGDLDTIRSWIAHTGIRWGIDEEHRAQLGLPRTCDNTWRAGLDRLLLGYALPGDDRTLFDGILPVREIEGSHALTLGRFVEFAEKLFARVPPLGDARPLPAWEAALREVLREFFDDSDEYADEVRRVRDVLGTLGDLAREAECGHPLSFEVIRAHLATALADTDSGVGFLAGCVTFCALKPMRAIPFKVICLLGMNDGAFPRPDTALAFDLVASGPRRRGDRSQREDDRYLFLEAILSARETLYISYCGLSPKDNSESPPSVVVSELLDYVAQNYSISGGKIRERIVTHHRLQPFSQSYFAGDARLFSYSAENARASSENAKPRVNAAAFAATPPPDPGAEWLAVDLDRLADFFTHPSRFFARERLRIALPDERDAPGECEPFTLDHLDGYTLGEELTDIVLAGGDPSSHRAISRAGGRLPHGYAGDSEFSRKARATSEFATEILNSISGAPLPARPVDIVLGDWRVTGTLRSIFPTVMLRHRAANWKVKDLLRAWVQHLALQLTADPPRETLVFALDAAWRYSAIEDPRAIFTDLLALYRDGLSAPLPLFPQTSFEFARRTLKPGARESAEPVASAANVWNGNEHSGSPGERDDPWFRLCFPEDCDPLDERWRAIALRVFGPLLAAREEVAS